MHRLKYIEYEKAKEKLTKAGRKPGNTFIKDKIEKKIHNRSITTQYSAADHSYKDNQY